MPKDQWRTSSRSYREAVRRGRKDKSKKVKRKKPHHTSRKRSYLIPAGTWCLVRKLPDGERKPHTTREEVVCEGWLWRSAKWWGFSHKGYEIMVAVGKFREVKVRLKQPRDLADADRHLRSIAGLR